jgi:predicted Rossmann fold flavoprotein
VSGGGRCNVTHACFEPKELVKFYPRGRKELLGPFHTFMTGDTMEWFESRDVPLKIEADNRVFPTSDNSQTIINCLTDEVIRLGIKVQTERAVKAFKPVADKWEVIFGETTEKFDSLVVASGGNSSDIWNQLKELGYAIAPALPSLFTFNTKDTRLRDLSGLSVPNASVKIIGSKLQESGPLLVTHWGVSGPAILKLSSVGASHLFDKDYKFQILVDWSNELSRETVLDTFSNLRQEHPKKRISKTALFNLPKRLWESLVLHSNIPEDKIWAELSSKSQNKLVENIKAGIFDIAGKSTNKEEFVTCGGVELNQINFTKFESRLHPNLFFVGEVLNIDALTGGFNFQAAWTGGFIASQAI